MERAVVVVGGNGLLGQQIVGHLQEKGVVAVCADLNQPENLEPNVPFIEMNVTSTDSVQAGFSQIASEYGSIYGLVNAAYPRNANYGKHFFEVTYEDFCENTSMNIGSMFLTCQEAARHMVLQDGGSIVNIGSIYGIRAPRFDIYDGTSMTTPVEYAAIKSGQAHLTRYIAQLLKKDGVRVNMVSPGGIRDGQPENFIIGYDKHGGTKGMLDPEDVAGTVLFLLSEEARYITGQNIIVDDGWTL